VLARRAYCLLCFLSRTATVQTARDQFHGRHARRFSCADGIWPGGFAPGNCCSISAQNPRFRPARQWPARAADRTGSRPCRCSPRSPPGPVTARPGTRTIQGRAAVIALLDTEFRTYSEVATGSRLAASGFLRCGTAGHYDRLAARARLAAREPGHLTSSAISGSAAVRQEMRGGSGRLTPGAGSRCGGG